MVSVKHSRKTKGNAECSMDLKIRRLLVTLTRALVIE